MAAFSLCGHEDELLQMGGGVGGVWGGGGVKS